MKLRIAIHHAEEGSFWVGDRSILGCAFQGEALDEPMLNVHKATEGSLSDHVFESNSDAIEPNIQARCLKTTLPARTNPR